MSVLSIKVRVYPSLAYNLFLRFNSGATPADLLMASTILTVSIKFLAFEQYI